MSTSARLIRAGDIIALGEGTTEVVRNVSIVVNLANGQTLNLGTTDTLEIVEPEPLPEIPESAENAPE